jgi:hypothetical protein
MSWRKVEVGSGRPAAHADAPGRRVEGDPDLRFGLIEEADDLGDREPDIGGLAEEIEKSCGSIAALASVTSDRIAARNSRTESAAMLSRL